MFRTKRKPKPSVTIIIPVRGRAEWAGQAVRSVIGQNGQFKLKVIVVDDSDDGQKIPGTDDKRVMVIRNTGKHHPSVSRNFGLSKTKSDYIGFLDYDDYYSSNFLSECITSLNNNPKASSTVVLSNKVFSSNFSAGIKLKIIILNYVKDLFLLIFYSFRKPITGEWSYLLQLSHQLFRRSMIKDSKFLPTLPFCEDWYFSANVLRYGHALIIPKRLTNFRYNSSSNTFSDPQRIALKTETYEAFYHYLSKQYPKSLGGLLFNYYYQKVLIKNG